MSKWLSIDDLGFFWELINTDDQILTIHDILRDVSPNTEWKEYKGGNTSVKGFGQFNERQYNENSHHGIFRCDTRLEESKCEIFTLKFGKKHGLMATVRGQDKQVWFGIQIKDLEPDYFLLYRNGTLIESSKSILELIERVFHK